MYSKIILRLIALSYLCDGKMVGARDAGYHKMHLVVACLAMTMVMRSGREGKENHAVTYNIVSIIVGKSLSIPSTIHLSFIR
jgi:hypothetical protein